jgi:3-deoxy-7-phosphoheptulonate synthase
MIVVMEPDATAAQVDEVEQRLLADGWKVHRSGEQQIVLGAVGSAKKAFEMNTLERLPGVREVVSVTRPYNLVHRAFRPEGTVVDVAGVRVGGDELTVIAGPCAVESRDQVRRAAAKVREAGASILRGGAFKPRSSPYAFQGLGEEGLRLLREAADEQQMPCVTEVLDPSDVDLVASYGDLLQVGARNMQNFRLLARLGACDKPILLKRGLSATLEELLMAAEYIVASGNPRVILCERGVRTFEPWTRNTLDLSAVPVMRRETHLPIIVDPSHAAGKRDYVVPMARAAIAAGADGVMIEVHPEPDKALCDGAQSLLPEGFAQYMADVRIMAPAVRRRGRPRTRVLPQRLTAPVFEQVAVVGTGLIGGSLALALREAGAVGRAVGVDVEANVDTIRTAGLVDEVLPVGQMPEALAGADLVVLAAPVGTIIEQLGEIGPHLRPGTVVTDVGGTKQAIAEAAQALPEGVHFVGGHPMAGSERRGASAARPLLFQDALYALCPNAGVPESTVERLQTVLKAIGAQPLVLEAARHDLLAATVSHVPHLVAVALSNSVGRYGQQDELALRLAAGGFRDVTRTASSPPELWTDILATNQASIRERLAALREVIESFEAALDSNQGLGDEMIEAARHRLSVPSNLPGLQRSDCELVVRVRDEPGELSVVTTALAQERINIRDIQVLKVRQDEDGVLRLAFADRPDTERAAEVLRRAGQDVRLRSDS